MILGDPHAQRAGGVFEFAQPGLVEQRGELAHQIGIDLMLGHWSGAPE